jgi:tetratricopeptide (TPR) repeat protein
VQGEAYRLLALHPGPSFGVAAAVALLGVSAPQARDVLDELVDACLLQSMGDDRHRFHNLIGQHARRCALADLDEARRRVAVRAVVMWYVERGIALAKVISRRWWVGEEFQRIPAANVGSDAWERASAELRAEQLNLRAAVRAAEDLELNAECAQLCQALCRWYYDTDRNTELIEVMSVGVRVAERAGQAELTMRMWHDLGSAYEKLGELAEALDAFRESGRLARQDGNALAEASAIEWEGLIHEQSGDFPGALDRLSEAWAIIDTSVPDPIHRPRALALLRMHIGRVLAVSGRAEEGIEGLVQARRYFADHHEVVNMARATQTLGDALACIGQLREAEALLGEALAGFEEARFRSQQLKVLVSLTTVHVGLDDRVAARECLGRARELALELGLVKRAGELSYQINQLDE